MARPKSSCVKADSVWCRGYASCVSAEPNTVVEPRSLLHPSDGRGTVHRLRAAVDLLHALTEADLRFRYGRGPLRLLRWLLEPFALVGVYLVLVTFVLRRPGEAPGLSLAAAILPFQLVMATVTNAMVALDIRRPILLNMSFRRNLIPVSAALTESMSFSASFLLVVVMMAAYRVAPTPMLLWLPLVLLVSLYFAVATAYAASLLGIWLREFRPFLLSFVRMLFFLGPGLVPLSQTSTSVRRLLELNPFTGLFESYRDIFLTGRMPAAWQLIYPVAIASLVLAVFVPLFQAEQRQFAKVL
jgi:ABC-type polysaccharide/polyol phosphate export permease